MALIDIAMPKLGESIMEATIIKWCKQVGDRVKKDETLLEIATDKVDSEVPVTSDGVVKQLLYKENEVVAIGAIIARIEDEANIPISTPALLENPSGESIEDEQDLSTTVPYVPSHVTPHPPTSSPASATTHRFYSPLVLTIAKQENLSMEQLDQLPGTGADGRLTKQDLLLFLNSRTAAPTALPSVAPTPPFIAHEKIVAKTIPLSPSEPTIPSPSSLSMNPNETIIEMDRMRKRIAQHMVESVQTSPHVTSFVEADVTNMVVWRTQYKKRNAASETPPLSYMPMFVECVARVIKKYPLINSSVVDTAIHLKKDINIGIATALLNGNLIVPVVRNADEYNLIGLSKKMNALTEAAKQNKLKPDDTALGSFTISNMGTFGNLMGTPIINQPQVAILALGIIKKRPMVIETPHGDSIEVRQMMYLSLSYDHRIVDGSVGGRFLKDIANEFERWDVNRTI